MAETDEKQLAPGVRYLLMIYRLFNKVDRRNDCSFLIKYDDLKDGDGLRVFDHNSKYLLPPFVFCDPVMKNTIVKRHITYNEGKSSGFGVATEVSNLIELQADRDIARKAFSRVTDFVEYNISYKLRLVIEEIEDNNKKFWGNPFKFLLQVANEKDDTKNGIKELYDNYGTHYISYVEVGLKVDSHSESNQSSNAKRKTMSAGLSFPKIGNLSFKAKKSSVNGKNVSNESQTNYGNDEMPVVLRMRAQPLWTLRPVQNVKGAVAKFKRHFFYQLEQQRQNWSPPGTVGNYCDDEPSSRARIDSQRKEWFLVVIKDERLRVEHNSTLCAFNCIVDKRCDGARFQIWKPEIEVGDCEYRLIFDMEVNLLEEIERYEVTADERIDIKRNYVIGIMVPSNFCRQPFPNKHHFTFPIKCKPSQAVSDNNLPCWRMRGGNKPQLNKKYGFEYEEFKDEAGNKSVPLIGLEFKVSDIAYYKHMICDDPDDVYEVEFDDKYIDSLKNSNWAKLSIADIRDYLNESNAEIAEHENLAAKLEEETKTMFEGLLGSLQEWVGSLLNS